MVGLSVASSDDRVVALLGMGLPVDLGAPGREDGEQGDTAGESAGLDRHRGSPVVDGRAVGDPTPKARSRRACCDSPPRPTHFHPAEQIHDQVVLQAVDEVEALTGGLAAKIWQKIMVLDATD